ncbi:MAG: glutamine amidotransferase [Elusimicrobia bacterium]|nr:MAG: glutamine amidotransferase [Elusimicrobiota bacterium]
MNECKPFLIIDGYPKESRDEFDVAGMKHAWRLYADMLERHVPDAKYKVWLPSDNPELPENLSADSFRAILWTGCNLTIFDRDDPSVTCQIEFAKRIYEVGTPSFGSCWGLQMAAVAAGGEVKKSPLGREMGFARRIRVTAEGLKHPMTSGKPPVYIAFASHFDEVTSLPAGAQVLASNDYARVQALAVTHKKGTFWGVQYHPEYDLSEMARLIVSRRPKLLKTGFFANDLDLDRYVEKLEALHKDPHRKDLRWQLDVDDDVISPEIRQYEFAAWLKACVGRSLINRNIAITSG